MTRCKHKHNDDRGKISDARESGVTLCCVCVAFFIHFPLALMCIVMWGPSELGGHRPWSMERPEPGSAGCRAWLSLGRDTSGDTVTPGRWSTDTSRETLSTQ